MIMKIVNDCLTGIDNRTFDIGRLGIAGGLIMLFILEIVKVFISHQFSEMQFSAALCAILGIGSGALAIKSKTEPPSDAK